MKNPLPIFVDIPHDGVEGCEIAEPELVGPHTWGRDYGASEIFGGQNVLHEVKGNTWRDLCDLNRPADMEGDDGRFKRRAMSLIGEAFGPEIWKDGMPSDEVKSRFASLAAAYDQACHQALADSRVEFVEFCHTMGLYANGSTTAKLKPGAKNALVSVCNGGDERGDGERLLCPPDQARLLVQIIESKLCQVIGSDNLKPYLNGNGPVSLGDYSGRTSADRYEATRSRKTPSVLIEVNRALIGHPEDPMFDLIKDEGLPCPERVDYRNKLHEVMKRSMEEFCNWYYPA